MIYSSLKIGPNGGIVADMEKVAQDPDTVTLAIGIGGTGVTALRTFKNAVYTRLISDNDDKEGEEPRFDRIKFLAIDSDRASCNGEGYSQIARSEYFGIGVSNIVESLNNKSALDSDFTLQWFDHENIKVDTAKDGACGVREIGRYLIIKKAYELKTKIEETIRAAMVGLTTPNIFVHIFSGISGGTGSGCFLDTCYIVRQALLDNGWLDMTSVMGFFFLPDVNLNSPGFPNDLAHSQYVQENGYAAMKELDFVMNLKDGDEQFVQDYGSFRVMTSDPPVNECHLVSTTEIDGTTPKNAFSYIMNAVSEYALNYIAKYTTTSDENDLGATVGSGGSEAKKGLVANLVTLRNAMQKRHGVNYRYNIMGASSAIIPYREIATYLATGLFNYFDFYNKIPSEADVRKFAMTTGLSFIDLEREILNGCMPPQVPDIPAAQLKQGNAPLVNRLNSWYDTTSGKMRENYDKLTRELPEGNWDIPQNPDSVIGKVFKELIMLSRDPRMGPIFAKSILRHDNQLAIDNVLEGVLKEVQERIHTEQIQRNIREEELNKAKSEFLNTGSLNPMLNSRKNRYVSEYINMFNHMHNLERLGVIEDLVTNVRQKLNKLYNTYFIPLASVMNDLKETFDENRNLFKAGLHHDDGKQYVWNIIELKAIQPNLDEEIKKVLTRDNQGNLTATQAMIDFMFLMTDPGNVEKWMSGKEGLIAILISSFIKSKFNEAINQSMITYLRNKYNTDGQNLINLIAHNVIGEGLVNNATPAFYADNSMFNVKVDSPIQCVLSVPDTENLVEQAAETYKEENSMHMSIRKTAIKDRISMMWFYTGVPMFAYRSLRDTEKIYKRVGSHGIHLYEKGEVKWRTYLPSPLPATLIIDTYEDERLDRARIDRVKDAYTYAMNNGLMIKHEDDTVEIPVIESIDFEALSEQAKKNDEERGKVLEQLETLKRDFMKDVQSKKVTLASGIDPRIRSNVDENGVLHNPSANVDVIVRYPKLMNELIHTVEQHRELDKMLDVLNGESDVNRKKYIELFIKAVYAGVIKTNGSIFRYTYEKDGFPEEKQFTSATKDFNAIPIFQAADEFAAMKDVKLRNRIENEVSAILDKEIPQAIVETAKKLEGFYDTDRLQEYLDEAAVTDKIDEIREFLARWKKQLRKFIKDHEVADFF